jgi:hypothetical protein
MRTRGKSALAISRWLPIRLEADADTAFEKDSGGESDECEERVERTVTFDARHAVKQRCEDGHRER